MLFPLNPNTPECQVFKVLNNELLHFLQACIQATNFDDTLFSRYQINNIEKISVCWTNGPTREKFNALWNVLPGEQQPRQDLYDLVIGAQNIAAFFDDTTLQLPEIADEYLFLALKELTSFLFTETMKRASTKEQSRSSINAHFQRFKSTNADSSLCFLCGTSLLSQDRIGIADEKQWRSDYDHILCKDKYPIYSVHPGNFMPTCHVCNSKAKGAKKVLQCKGDLRRIAFYPLPPSTESCYLYAVVEPQFRSLAEVLAGLWEDPIPPAIITFPLSPQHITTKIEVWKEVYQVPQRVACHISTNFCERITSDLRPRDFHDFCAQLERFSAPIPNDYMHSEWRFWWHRVYEYLNQQSPHFLLDIWSLIEWKIDLNNELDMEATFAL